MSNSMLSSFSEALDASEAAVRLLISILLGLPIALFHRYTLYGKSPILQHLFFSTFGLLICYWNYEINTLHSVAALCITYLILKFFGGTSLSVFVTFVFNMSYLLYGYYTTSTDDYDIKWTMPQCVLTLRLIGLAFNLMDGKKSDEKLSAMQKQVVLKERPTFLEVAAFTYFPGSFLVGPQFSMKRYLDFVNGRLIDDYFQSVKKDAIKLPDCVIPGLYRIFVGLVYVALFNLGTRYVPDQYLLSAEFQKHYFLKRLLMIGFWGHVNLYKYVCCWLLTEGVCTTFGLTYNGRDKNNQPIWNGCENIKLFTFEMATRFNHYIIAFNTNTNHWCSEYIYKRLKFLGSKFYSQFVTLMFLAIWHGFHSGYYVCFFMEFIIMFAERDLTQILERYEKLQNWYKNDVELQVGFWIFTKIYTEIFMGYSLIPFVFLSYTRYHQVYSSIYYCGHIIYLSYPIISLLLKKFLIKRCPKKLK